MLLQVNLWILIFKMKVIWDFFIYPLLQMMIPVDIMKEQLKVYVLILQDLFKQIMICVCNIILQYRLSSILIKDFKNVQ